MDCISNPDSSNAQEARLMYRNERLERGFVATTQPRDQLAVFCGGVYGQSLV
jgi:hypothetical protein